MEHSKTFGFSGGGIWSQCSGSVLLSRDEPELPDTPESLEGDAAHWVGEQMLVAFKTGQHLQSLIGQVDRKGTLINEDMYDAATVYVQDIIRVVGTDVDNLHIELRVKSGDIDPEAWGTCDAFHYDKSTNTLHVWDFKYGHSSVLAYENWQLIGYAKAYCETNELMRANPRLVLNIVQPRCFDGNGAIRTWVTALDQIRAHVNIMKSKVVEFRMNKSVFKTGPHCLHCKSAYRCQAITTVAGAMIDVSFDASIINPSAESLAYQKGLIDDAIERLKSKQSSIDIQIKAKVTRGELVPGYRMESAYGNAKWTAPVETVFAIGDLMGEDLRKKVEAITPSQAMAKLKKKGIDESVILNYSSKTKTGLKLVADDGSIARQIFSQRKL
jgi:hypothetical protein